MTKKKSAKIPVPRSSENAKQKKRGGDKESIESCTGAGGETRQQATGDPMTTNQGVPLSDDQNTLTVGPRGPQLLEDFVLREKITHFDHERIPERVVHARGYGAHGHFTAYDSNASLTKAAFLQKGARTPVFVRFSTVAGSKGSPDTARDVRGFAVKFYTSEGVYDLVGNNMPVFFIQDAMKFPDLIHSVKPEPDRDFPQAQSAHDTFWDFASLTPEATHMLLWVMSDRAIPRSFRMMDGFGIHTFRMINSADESRFVKFHWRPQLGAVSLIWDEAVQLAGADPDYHRRDLWNAIQRGEYPEWELSVQTFTEQEAEEFDFDVLDPTKLVPEELVPLTPIGRMVLDRTVDNFFAETEQVAFCPSHVVPGIDFSNDPLLQGRIFSYLDTQLSRLGGTNFHQLPINRSKSPVANLQRDAHMQTEVPKGRVAYEPNSIDPNGPRESMERGFRSYAANEQGEKVRQRPESFADHYTQARMFWKSMTPPEQRHIVSAFAFELGKCDDMNVRRRMLGQLNNVSEDLQTRIADALGMTGAALVVKPAIDARDVDPSEALSQYRGEGTIEGRTIGVLVASDTPRSLLTAIRAMAKREGAQVALVAEKSGPLKLAEKSTKDAEIMPDEFLAGAPSALFDAVIVALGDDSPTRMATDPNALNWLRDAFTHLKVIGYASSSTPLLERADIETASDGVIEIRKSDFDSFVNSMRRHRIWSREEN